MAHVAKHAYRHVTEVRVVAHPTTYPDERSPKLRGDISRTFLIYTLFLPDQLVELTLHAVADFAGECALDLSAA